MLAAVVLTAAAAMRGAEYDEQYTLFLTGGVARPIWPVTPFLAGEVRTLQSGHAGLREIARDLRATDVHPPLYFWAVALWRRVVGGDLFAARMFSVGCGLAALVAVGAIARSAGIPPALAMLLTLGCYGFTYTGSIARGFALAEALTLAGVALVLAARGRGMAFVGGVLLGAATLANYLAVFVAVAALCALSWPALLALGGKGVDGRRPCAAACGFVLALPLDFWFFHAQRGSRTGQFPPFDMLDSLHRLARYAAANLFGGLPLYVPDAARPLVSASLAALACLLAGLVAIRWRYLSAPVPRRLLASAAIAPPLGLLALGVAFHTTPVELRYLASATPFAALLLAGALASLPCRTRNAILAVVLIVQAAAIVGLSTRPETMQPARATAAAAAGLVEDGVVLVPRGNDGVGIVGAFAIESPPSLRLMVVDRDESPEQILRRVGPAHRVVLALMAQDDASRATLPVLLATFAPPCWRQVADGFNVRAYDSACGVEAPR